MSSEATLWNTFPYQYPGMTLHNCNKFGAGSEITLLVNAHALMFGIHVRGGVDGPGNKTIDQNCKAQGGQ